jgi:hypothetical protein
MFWVKLATGIAAAGLVAVGAIAAYGMYLNAQDELSCADLYPNDWKQYEACRAILERVRELERQRIRA